MDISKSMELRVSFILRFSLRALMYRSFHMEISRAIIFLWASLSSRSRFYSM